MAEPQPGFGMSPNAHIATGLYAVAFLSFFVSVLFGTFGVVSAQSAEPLLVAAALMWAWLTAGLAAFQAVAASKTSGPQRSPAKPAPLERVEEASAPMTERALEDVMPTVLMMRRMSDCESPTELMDEDCWPSPAQISARHRTINPQRA